MPLKEGQKAPAFTLQDDQEKTVSLNDFRGKKVILYFYPKDSTPGCTTEACDFQSNLTKIKRKGAVVLGISKDNIKSHEKFKDAQGLKFPLLADTETTVCQQYGVLVDKSMFGRKYKGIQRATFLIDEDGKIEKIWPKVKVAGHVDEIITHLT